MWQDYLDTFHGQRPGVTEDLLRRVLDDRGRTPYDWLVEGSEGSDEEHVVDLACGSAPLCGRLGGRYTALDRSGQELELARRRCPDRRFVIADAAELVDLVDDDVTTVVCSMSLQLLQPLDAVLDAVAAVLVPGGVLVATMPDRRPLRPRDQAVWLVVLAVLGSRLPYPNDAQLRRLPQLLRAAGLRPVHDERRRFDLPLADRGDAERLIASLYLPGVSQRRQRAAVRALTRLTGSGRGLGLPLRRIVAARQ